MWIVLPAFPVIGFIIGLVWLRCTLSANEDKILASFGNYDLLRGGMGVIAIPDNFSDRELQQFYVAINNKSNVVLSSHEFAVALVRQGNGIRQVHLNAYPDIQDDEYSKINDEIKRQMDVTLGRSGEIPLGSR
jgi:hypothetical protein